LNENSSNNGTVAKGNVGQQDEPQRSGKNGGKRRRETKSQDESDEQKEGSKGKRPRRSPQSVKDASSSNSDNNRNENDDTSAGIDGDNSNVFDDAVAERDSKKAKTAKEILQDASSSVTCSSVERASIAAAIMAIPVKKRERKTAWPCIRCGRVFKSSAGLQYHIDKLVCMEEDIANKFKCKICKRVFKSETGLRYHVERRVCTQKITKKNAQKAVQKIAKEQKIAKAKAKKAQSKPDNTESFKCPHCDKAFKTPNGLQYHVDKRVCIYLDGSVKKKGPPKKRPRRSHETFHDLTCPHCKRVFKSLDGVKYHVEQKVCLKGSYSHAKNGEVLPFSTLEPGKKFVTPFGVVEVVKDDRATPTAVLPDDAQQRYRKYQKAQIAIEAKELRRHAKIASKLRIRREAVSALYEKGKANRRSVFDAYFGGDPEHIRSVIKANEALANDVSNTKSSSGDEWRTSDPKIPKDSYPNRIVECKLITDHRWHNLDSTNTRVKRSFNQKPAKMFLQRRLLKEPYEMGDTAYHCPDCGKKFHNSQSRKLHCAQKKCIQDAKALKEKREKTQLRIERDAEDYKRFPERRKFIKNEKAKRVTNKTNKPRKWKKKKKAESSIYPEVVIGMGFKLVTKKKITPTNVIRKSNIPQEKKGLEIMDLLDNLKGSLRIQQRKANDQRHGSIYAEVYSVLGFKHPRKRRGGKVGNNVSERKRRKRTTKPKPPQPPKPLPPAIDVGALADEIKSGRYPSFKVYEGEHADECVLCRNGGTMYCCEFCGNVEHFKCLLTKFTVKEPEPDEDFMCHRCIGVILSRRARAEKRRLRKQSNNEKLTKEEEAENDPSDGNEYPDMASQAREVNELVELLKDAQVRLRRSIETTKINNIRRQLIAGVYPAKF